MQVVTDGSRSLLYLPAAVMLPREPLDLGTCPDLGPYRITRAVLAAVYGLLQASIDSCLPWVTQNIFNIHRQFWLRLWSDLAIARNERLC